MKTLLLIMLAALSVSSTHGQCASEDAVPAADNVCSNSECTVDNMTMSIETVNAAEVKFVFVAPGGMENVITDVITEVDEWVYSEASYPGPVESSHIQMVWGSNDFMYANLSVSACGDGCEMEYCHDVEDNGTCTPFSDVDTNLPNGTYKPYTEAELEAETFRINKGESLCIKCVTGKPFRILGGSMTITGHENLFTYTVTYFGVTSPRVSERTVKSRAGKFPSGRAIKRNINGAGFLVTKIYISADKDITVTNLKLDLCK